MGFGTKTCVSAEYIVSDPKATLQVLTSRGFQSCPSIDPHMENNVKAALIKDTSIANQLNLRFYNQQRGRKLTIKLEIDANPPAGSGFEYVQYGPWQGQDVNVDRAWLVNTLRDKITSIDWRNAAADVARFLRPVEQKSLQLWSERFYLHKLEQLNERLGGK